PAADEHRRIGTGDLARAGQHRRQRRRGTDYLLEHRRSVDFLSERDVFLLKSFLADFAIVDVGTGDIPADYLSFAIANRIGADQKPAVASVAFAKPQLQLVGRPRRASGIKAIELPRSVVWMNKCGALGRG